MTHVFSPVVLCHWGLWSIQDSIRGLILESFKSLLFQTFGAKVSRQSPTSSAAIGGGDDCGRHSNSGTNMSQRAEDLNPPTQDTAYTFQSTSMSRLQIRVRTHMRKFMCDCVWKIHIRAQCKVWTRQFAHMLQWFLTCVTVPIYFLARLGPNFLNDCLLWCQMGNGCFLKGVVSRDNHKDVCEGVFPVLEFFVYLKTFQTSSNSSSRCEPLSCSQDRTVRKAAL